MAPLQKDPPKCLHTGPQASTLETDDVRSENDIPVLLAERLFIQ